MEKSNGSNLPGGVIFTPPSSNDYETGVPLIVGCPPQQLERRRYRCRYLSRFKKLALMQILMGLLVFAAGLYTHVPVFGGWTLLPREDRWWFATWIGVVNFLCGIVGRLATKSTIADSVHIPLRRWYFCINASVVLYCNGIGITAYIISLTHFSLIQTKDEERFSAAMAFICVALLIPCFILNVVAVIYQTLATRQCKCWICDPRNKSTSQENLLK